MKSSKPIASVICLCLITGSFAFAQQGKTDQKPEAKAKPASKEVAKDQTKTRARRVAENSQQTSTKSEAEPEDAAKPTEEQPKDAEPAVAEQPKTGESPANEESASQPTHEKAQPTPPKELPALDEITELRDQIEVASTPAEKTRLQLQLAEKLVAKGAKQEAINELRNATAAEKFDPQGFYNIGNALARIGDSEGAVIAYQKAIEQRKGRYSKALNNLGVIQLRQGLWDQAYESLMNALRLENFRYAEASYNMGRLYAARGESDLALREWRRAVSVNPEHTAAKQALAGSASFNRVAVASAPAPRRPSNNKSTPIMQPTTAPIVKSSSPKATKPRPVTHTVDRETYGYLQTARTSRERNRLEEAVANYQRVISKMGGYFAPANLEMSYALITLKRDGEAITALTPVVEQDGARYPISYYHLARLYEGRGDLKIAEENFVRAADFYKQENPQMLLDVSRVREKMGNVQGAITILEEYLALMTQKNLKPDWSDARLASLREKLSASPPKQ